MQSQQNYLVLLQSHVLTTTEQWNTIVPNRDQGEGYVYRYDIRYYECGEKDNAIIIDGGHPPAMSDQQMMTIPNVDPDSDYSVQVRVIVLIQSEPDVRFGVGRWSGDVCRDSTTTGNYICLMTSVVILCNKQDSILFELCVLNCHYD